MKNTLIKISIAILCVVSVLIIVISDEMMQARIKGLTSIYPIILPLAVLFIHWVFIRYYIPFNPNESRDRNTAAMEAKKYYVRSFWAGSIGLGYSAILSYVLIWFLMTNTESKYPFPNPVPFGVVFIFIGLLTHVHAHLKFFITERRKGA